MSSSNKRSLDTIDFSSDFLERIERYASAFNANSPHSKKVLSQMGIDYTKLFFISLQDYLSTHPEIRGASPEIQEKRYLHYESKRLIRIAQAKEIRNELIKAEENPSVELRKTQSCFNLTDSFYKKELDRLDQMKKHQISEVKSIIDYELQMNGLRNMTNMKIKLFQEQEEQLQEQRLKEQAEKAARLLFEEKEREEKMKKEDLRKYFQMKKKAEEEKQKKDEEQQRKEQLERESQKRQQEQLKHHEEIQKKLNSLIMKQKYEQSQKIKENEQKEENRKRLFEERKRENLIKTKRVHNKAQGIICKTNMKNEEESLQRRQTYEKKQMLKHSQMKKYAQELERKNQEHNDKVREKVRKIIEFSQKNYFLTLKKIEDYDNKSDFIEHVREQNKKKRHQELLMRISKTRSLEKDNNVRKSKVDASINLRHVMLLEKYYQSEEKIKQQKEIGYKATLDKLIDHKFQFDEVNENFSISNKQSEYKKKAKMEEMNEKSKRVEDYQSQKQRIIERSRLCQEKMKARKEEMLSKIHRLLQSGKGFTPEEMYKKVFTQEEYNTLISRTPSQCYRSAFISPNHSGIDFSPKLIVDKDTSYKTYNKWYTLKGKESKEESNKLPEEESLFVTQERYKSLDKIVGS